MAFSSFDVTLDGMPAEVTNAMNASAERVDQLSSAAVAYSGSVTTTDATVTTVLSFTPPDEGTTLVEASIIGVKSDGSASAAYKVFATVGRDGGTTSLIGAATQAHVGESAAGYNATIDVSDPSVRIRVTGVAATTFKWYAHVVATTKLAA